MKELHKKLFSRIRFSRKAILNINGKSYGPCPITHLSLSGMFVQGMFDVKLGDNCQVIIMQTGSVSESTINVLAKVVRIDQERLVIGFTSLGRDSHVLLQAILLFEAEYPFSDYPESLKNCHFDITEVVPSVRKRTESFQ